MKKDALYYTITPGSSFQARVLSCQELSTGGDGQAQGFLVTLDTEGFYPEGGGQASDRGWIGEAKLLRVLEDRENPDTVPLQHFVDRVVPVGTSQTCTLDWDWRRRNSQNHSGEHILSGLVHRQYQLDNVGFHMSMEGVCPMMTIDFDGELSWEQLTALEEEANRIVWENREIRNFYPTEQELEVLPYRSKKRLTGTVRLVEIPGADLCACCGTHVRTTGEIGLIKCLSLTKHRGGVRIELVCGDAALLTFRRILTAATQAGQLLSVPAEKLPEAIQAKGRELVDRDARIARIHEKLFRLRAEQYRRAGTELIIDFPEDMNPVELRRYCDTLVQQTEARAVAVFLRKTVDVDAGNADSARREEYFYVLGSRALDLRAPGKELNRLLQGRGGGQASMLQGTLSGTRQEITDTVQSIFDAGSGSCG